MFYIFFSLCGFDGKINDAAHLLYSSHRFSLNFLRSAHTLRSRKFLPRIRKRGLPGLVYSNEKAGQKSSFCLLAWKQQQLFSPSSASDLYMYVHWHSIKDFFVKTRPFLLSSSSNCSERAYLIRKARQLLQYRNSLLLRFRKQATQRTFASNKSTKAVCVS